jgi:hypothetical protein
MIMMIRNWKIPVLKEGKQILIFVTTSSSMVDVDLNGDPEKSLIRKARQYHRHGQNEEQNHRDLAIGAIMSFAGCKPYDISDTHVVRCDSIPEGGIACQVGGRDGNSLVPIREMPSEPDDGGSF